MNGVAPAAVTGLNHITLAVADVEQAVAFYRDGLGFSLRALWSDGAYLEAGSLWLCLSKDSGVCPRTDYTHVAFSIDEADLPTVATRLGPALRVWKDNESKGASLYILDVDGHRLELHAGTLETRLDHYRRHPRPDLTIL